MTLEAKGVDLVPIREDAGMQSLGRAITATLRVSPNGRNTDGSSWLDAYTTIQAALDVASTDEGDCTLIVISPHTTFYDIALPGNPTWGANVILHGTHRNWSKVQNSIGSSIMRLTGKASAINLNFNLGTGTNGLRMTHGGGRVYSCQFVGEDLTSPRTALHLDHASGGKHAKIIDCDFLGDGGVQMTGILIDQFARSNFERLRLHECATAIQLVGANSDSNIFNKIDMGENALALDIDAGNEQHFYDLIMHHNTVNVDDEVGNHIWLNIYGQFQMRIEPDNLTGVQVDTGAANTYGGDTEIRAAVASTRPFRIVAVHLQPSTSEWYQVRFSTDSGATFYDVFQFDGTKREGIAAPSGTEFIFNAGTRISASARDVSGGDNVKIWLEIQEI